VSFSELIPVRFRATINRVLDLARDLLQGEPALVIGNGAAVVIYLVAKFMGAIPDQTFGDALASATAGIATVNAVLLTIRKYVYSPATVAKIVLTPPSDVGPVKAAVEAGAGDAVVAELEKQEPIS